jgi:hypothetical protein
MDEEFEFHFKNYDESKVNRARAEWPHGDNAMRNCVDGRRTRDEEQLTAERIGSEIILAALLRIAIAVRGDSPAGAGNQVAHNSSGSESVAHGLASPPIC